MKRMLKSLVATALCALALSQAAAVALTSSPRYARAQSNPIDDTSFYVEQLYIDVLGRASDPSGFAAWTNYIDGCGADAACINQRRITTARGFIESAEFRSSHPTLSQYSVGDVPYDQEYVRELYRHLLRREPEGHPDMFDNPWFVYIRSHPGDYDTLVGGFINSIEYRTRFD